MRIPGDRDAAAIEIARFVEFAHLFECLAAVEIGGGIIGIGFRDLFESRDGSIKVAGLDVFHREPVAGKGARRILIEELLKDFDASGFQTVRIACN
jgi:hypothetical protein